MGLRLANLKGAQGGDFKYRPMLINMKTLALSLLLLAGSAAADVATVVAIRGDVYTDKQQLHQGSTVDTGVTITSGDKSFAVLQFYDGAKITIRPKSQLVLDKYSEEGVQLDLITGGLRIVTGAIAKSDPEKYKLSTPTALMGVRGTEFSVLIVD